MTEKGAEAGRHGRVRTEMRSHPDGGGALQQVEQERERGKALVAGAQDIGGADIAGADLTEIAEPGELGEEQSEGDGAEQIAEREAQEAEVRRTGRCHPNRQEEASITLLESAPLRPGLSA